MIISENSRYHMYHHLALIVVTAPLRANIQYVMSKV